MLDTTIMLLYLLLLAVSIVKCERTYGYVYVSPVFNSSDLGNNGKDTNKEMGYNYSRKWAEYSDRKMLTPKQLSGLGCGAVYSSPEIRIQSPQFPGSYPINSLCLYVLNAVAPNVCLLEVNFLTFDLGSCGSGDQLIIAGQTLCGFLNGIQTFRYSLPASLIQFRSGIEPGGKGFDLVIRQKICPSLPTPNPQCSGIFRNPNVILQSPGFPGQYPKNVRCEYVLSPVTTSPQTSLCLAEFQFEQFSVQSSDGCTGDRLQIGDQDVLCGTLGGVRTYQFLQELRVNFFSGVTGNSGTFRIIVTQLGCTPLTLTPGGILPPQPPTVFPPTQTPPTIFPPVPTPPTIFPPIPTPTIFPPPQTLPTVRPPIFPTVQPTFPPILPTNYPISPPIYPPFPTEPPISGQLPRCCAKVYQSKILLLTSPGFPFSTGNEDIDCLYEIRPYSQDACRLKIVFKLFWVGEEDSYAGCLGGFLEIDGRKYCDCKTGTIIRSEFVNNWSGKQKYIRYRRDSNIKNAGGFLLEVFQESCSGWFPWSRSDIEQIQYDQDQHLFRSNLPQNYNFHVQNSNMVNCKTVEPNYQNTSCTLYSPVTNITNYPRNYGNNLNTTLINNQMFPNTMDNHKTITDKQILTMNTKNDPNYNKNIPDVNSPGRSKAITLLKNAGAKDNDEIYSREEHIPLHINQELNQNNFGNSRQSNNYAKQNTSPTSINEPNAKTNNSNTNQSNYINIIKPNGCINRSTITHKQESQENHENNIPTSFYRSSTVNKNSQNYFDNPVSSNGSRDNIENNNSNKMFIKGASRCRNGNNSDDRWTDIDKRCNETEEPNRNIRSVLFPDVSSLYYAPNQQILANFAPEGLSFLGESSCRIWGFAQWLFHVKQYFWSFAPQLFCPVQSQSGYRCQIYNQPAGWLQSPAYPQAYPNNVNYCYRFPRLQEFCQIQMRVMDFSLEYSYNCNKDYFMIAGQKYCGEQLAYTFPLLDMTSSQYVDMVFASDGSYTGRGYRIYYQYLPCNRRAQIVPNCGLTTRNKYFILTKSEHEDEDLCTYNILQNNTDVCGVQLTFSTFELLCGQESLLIGNRRYCGSLSGHTMTTDFQNGELKSVYKSLGNSNRQSGNFFIRGHQLQDCGLLDISKVPAQRKSTSSQCEIQLSDMEGFVSSPLESTTCAYLIHPQQGMCSVQINFHNFDIPSESQSCHSEFMEIQEIKYCNSQLDSKTFAEAPNTADHKFGEAFQYEILSSDRLEIYINWKLL